jgi:succinate dehydrogenase flavin-adding protein (antitoxin of CptAB toxin-antitoxin module)
MGYRNKTAIIEQLRILSHFYIYINENQLFSKTSHEWMKFTKNLEKNDFQIFKLFSKQNQIANSHAVHMFLV